MNKPFFILSIIILLVLSSCIPQKSLVYLQNTDNNESKQPVNQVVKTPYRVQSFDILVLKVKTSDSELSKVFNISDESQQKIPSEVTAYYEGFTIDEQGNIRIPILGEVNVIGLTLEEIRLKIEKKLLEEYFKKESNLFVTVKMSGLRYTINGEINSPGTNVILQQKVNIMEAIANSGDITNVGNRKNVKIIRQFPYGTETYSLDLTNIEVMNSPYYYLQPNDYIYIEPLRQKSWGTGTTGLQTISTLLSVFTLLTTTILLIQR